MSIQCIGYSQVYVTCVECSQISSPFTDQTDIAVHRYGMRCTTAGLENRIIVQFERFVAENRRWSRNSSAGLKRTK